MVITHSKASIGDVSADAQAARVEVELATILAPDVFRERVVSTGGGEDVIQYRIGAPSGHAGGANLALDTSACAAMTDAGLRDNLAHMIKVMVGKYGCAAA